MILVDAERVTMSRPERPLFTELSVTVKAGDRLAIVGINGSGKSTLARVLAGAEPPEAGTVRRGRGVRVAFLDQRSELPPGLVRDLIGTSWQAESIADRLGVTPLFGADSRSLSGGEAKRVALARCLVEEADLLILDEPTNHLDIDAIAWLERHLADHRGGLVLITHDRFVLDAVTTRILEIDRGRGYVHDGGYASYLDAQLERAARADTAEATRRNLARRELEWLRRGAQARSTKQKARVARAVELIETRPEAAARGGDLTLDEFNTPRLGDLVVELHGAGHRFDGEPIFSGLDLALDRRDRLGIVGPNGSGKSTALDIVAGVIAPTEGTVVRGPTARIGYYDQRGRTLDPSRTVRQLIAGDRGEIDWRDKALMERFWFDNDAQHAPVGLLSGGERRRLQLLLMLAARPNVMLLDEPTNDLDIDTLRALEGYLDEWPGALVVVSHDRAFLERTCDDFVIFERGTVPSRREGGLLAWIESRRMSRPRPADAARTAPTARPPAAAKPSLSTLRHRLRTLDRELAPLQARKAELVAALADATSDHRRLESTAAELAALTEQLSALEDEWLTVASQLDDEGA